MRDGAVIGTQGVVADQQLAGTEMLIGPLGLEILWFAGETAFDRGFGRGTEKRLANNVGDILPLEFAAL